MTIRQLSKRIDFWMKRLYPLGLCHWTIQLSVVEHVENEFGSACNASCSCSSHYDTMWLEFRKDFIETASADEIDNVIVHELVHATMRDFDHVSESVSQWLGEPHKSSYQEELMHAREGFVEKVARAVVHSAGQDVVRYT